MHYTHYIVPTLTTTKEVEEKAITRNEEIWNIAVQENAKYKHLKEVAVQENAKYKHLKEDSFLAKYWM
jgi:hypothetical protein